jgi:hypothetical protein
MDSVDEVGYIILCGTGDVQLRQLRCHHIARDLSRIVPAQTVGQDHDYSLAASGSVIGVHDSNAVFVQSTDVPDIGKSGGFNDRCLAQRQVHVLFQLGARLSFSVLTGGPDSNQSFTSPATL